ncbi:MAG: hypothetical protein ACM3MK_07385 [Chitinophagales bacterium]
MLSFNHKKYQIYCLILLFLLSGLSGCNKKPSAKPAPTKSQDTPSQVKKMKTDLQSLESMLDKREKEKFKTAQTGSQNDSSNQGTTSGAKKESSTKKTGGQDTGQTSNTAGQKAKNTQDQAWQKEMKQVAKLHEDWNALEPQALAHGLSSGDQSAMETSLGELTRAVNQHMLLESRMQANKVYGSYIKVAALFGSKNPPGLELLRYQIKQAALLAESYDWSGAALEAENSLATWRNQAYSLGDVKPDLVQKTDHSITDFQQAITEQSMSVMMIKKDIVLKNLDQIDKVKKQSSQSS